MGTEHDVARRHCQRLRALIALNSGGSRNDELLDQLHARMRAAAASIDDLRFHQHLDTVERYARDLLSDDAHQRWAQSGLSGAAVLRLHMVGEIDAALEHLEDLETVWDLPVQVEDQDARARK